MKFTWILSLLLFSPTLSYALKYDLLVGIRISQFASQKILSAPFLPTLDEDKRFSVAPYLSNIVLESSGATSYESAYSGTQNIQFSGKVRGWNFGAGYTKHLTPQFALFGFGLYGSTEGEINIIDQTVSSSISVYSDLKNISNQGAYFVAGASYRLWTKKDFPLSTGILGGWYYSYFKNKFQYLNSSNAGESYEDLGLIRSNVKIYGPMAGIQTELEFLNLKLNPYFLYYYDISNVCESYSAERLEVFGRATSDVTDECANQNERTITVDGSFYAYGLNLSLFGLSLNVYSDIQKNEYFDTFKSRNIAVTYVFKF